MRRRSFIDGEAASELRARNSFVTNCRTVTFASFLVLGAWALSANSEPNETNAPQACLAFPRFCELIKQEAERTGLDPALIDAVIKVESDYRPDTIGAAGEIGLMQVLPSTARLLGFDGTDQELAEPATNIRLGVTYLAKAWNLAQGDLCRALMKYRAGHGEDRMSSTIGGVLPPCSRTSFCSRSTSSRRHGCHRYFIGGNSNDEPKNPGHRPAPEGTGFLDGSQCPG